MKDASRLVLRAAQPADAEPWWRWRQEAAARRFMPLEDLSVKQLARRIESGATDLADRSRSEVRWIVELEGRAIGSVSVSVAWRMGYAEIGYMLGERWQGRGLGSAALGLLVAKVFDETDLERLYVTVSADNPASLRVAEKAGFVREGVLRGHYRIEGRRVDQVILGLLRGDLGNGISRSRTCGTP